MHEVAATEAEKIAGFRVDRRRRYAVNDDRSPCDVSGAVIFALGKYTLPCSGCNCDCHPGCSHGASGCDECGYTGKRRTSFWAPYLRSDAPKCAQAQATQPEGNSHG